MSTEEKIHSISGDVCDSDKDLREEQTDKTTVQGNTEQIDATTIQPIEEKCHSYVPLVQDDVSPSKSLKEEIKIEKDIEFPSGPTIEDKINVRNQSIEIPFQAREDSVKKQEEIQVPSTIVTENNNSEAEFASNLNDIELKIQESGKQTATERPPEDSINQEDGDEMDSKPTEETQDLQTKSEMHPKLTSTIKKEDGNSTETLEDVKNQGRREQNTTPETNKKDKASGVQHVNVGGCYFLAIGLMIVCVAIILGGFFWRIGYAVAGYHEDFLKTTACPTLNPSVNDNTKDHSVMKVLQKAWRNESDELVSD